MFVVTVNFTIATGEMAGFMPLMLANARQSLEQEPDCHQFDVCTDPATPQTVFLYEVYQNKAAFDAHLLMPHFLQFNEATAHMIVQKDIQTFTQVAQ